MILIWHFKKYDIMNEIDSMVGGIRWQVKESL